MRKVYKLGTKIYHYTKFCFWDVPKFFLWSVPKWVVSNIWRGISKVGLKKFGKWIFFDVPRFILWDVPKCIFWDLPQKIPHILLESGKWVFRVIAVHLPAFFKAVGKAVWRAVKGLGEMAGSALSNIASAIHSILIAITTFFRQVTLRDVLRSFKQALNAIFVQVPLVVWKGIKELVSALDKLFCNIFDIFWLIAKLLGHFILFVPQTIGQMLLEIGSLLGTIGREVVLFIYPKF